MRIWPVFAAAMLCAQTAGDDVITDRMRYEIAAAQRDYLVAKQQLDAAAAHLKDRIEQAEKACGARNASFDPMKFVCKANPSEAKQP